METSAMCLNCIYATPLFNDDVLCKKKGVVKSEYHCKKHIMDLTTKNVRKKRTIELSK